MAHVLRRTIMVGVPIFATSKSATCDRVTYAASISPPPNTFLACLKYTKRDSLILNYVALITIFVVQLSSTPPTRAGKIKSKSTFANILSIRSVGDIMSRVASGPARNDPFAMLSVTAAEKRYTARRIAREGRPSQTHCIIAVDDEDAIYLAETISAGMPVELWEGGRFVQTINPD